MFYSYDFGGRVSQLLLAVHNLLVSPCYWCVCVLYPQFCSQIMLATNRPSLCIRMSNHLFIAKSQALAPPKKMADRKGSDTGWWFGTFFIFPYIGNFIIPIDFHIFRRGGPTTNQDKLNLFYLFGVNIHIIPSQVHLWQVSTEAGAARPCRARPQQHWSCPWRRRDGMDVKHGGLPSGKHTKKTLKHHHRLKVYQRTKCTIVNSYIKLPEGTFKHRAS